MSFSLSGVKFVASFNSCNREDMNMRKFLVLTLIVPLFNLSLFAGGPNSGGASDGQVAILPVDGSDIEKPSDDPQGEGEETSDPEDLKGNESEDSLT